MKITNVRTVHMMSTLGHAWTFVKVETDEGIHGWGEGTLEWRERAVEGSVADLAQYLVGKDPTLIEHHCRTIYRDSYWRSDIALQTALSAVEMAMWDSFTFRAARMSDYDEQVPERAKVTRPSGKADRLGRKEALSSEEE